MSRDASGNYYANVQDSGIFFPPNAKLLSGHGVPPASLGDNNDVYFDVDAKLLYGKAGDVWTVVSGSTTVEGGGGTLAGIVDPESVVTANTGVVYTNTAASPQKVFIKMSGSGNTGWVQVI